MKDYGNFVMKYVSGDKAPKYKPILADSLDDYHKAQVADLKRFLKEDFRVSGNRDNYLAYSANVKKQREEIVAEIKRLEGQLSKPKKKTKKKTKK